MRKACIALCLMFVMLFFKSTTAVASNTLYHKTFSKDEVAKITNEAMKAVKDERQIANIEALYDINLEYSYTLVEYSDIGYMIINNINDQYIEYNLDAVSPYIGKTNVTKVYAGPSMYYYYDKMVMYEVGTNNILDQKDLDNLKILDSELDQKAIASKSTTPTRTDEDVWIDYPSYFHYHYEFFPSNTHGTCAYVAIGLCLAYLDSFYNDDFIAEVHEYRMPRFEYDITLFDPSPGYDYSLEEELIYINEGVYPTYGSGITYGTTFDETVNVAEEYLEDIGFGDISGVMCAPADKISFTRNAIISGYPVVVALSRYNNETNQIERHMAVAYGKTSTGFIANMGSKIAANTHINISDYNIDNAFYITYNLSHHSHSDNFNSRAEGHEHETICSCGLVTSHTPIVWSDNSQMFHNVSCMCYKNMGAAYETHFFNRYTQATSVYHYITCLCNANYRQENHDYSVLISSNSMSHVFGCSACGTQLATVHSYLYNGTYNSTTHTLECKCGLTQLVNHDLYYCNDDMIRCHGCDYVTCFMR